MEELYSYRVTDTTLRRGATMWPPALSASDEVIQYCRAIERIDQDISHLNPANERAKTDKNLNEKTPLFAPITVAELVALHGAPLRTTANSIHKNDEVQYIPTPAERVPDELQASLDWLHRAPEHPLVKASTWMHEFHSIRPFACDHKRTALEAASRFLVSQGYQFISMPDYDVTRLDACRTGHWDRTPWNVHFLGKLVHAFHAAYEAAKTPPVGLNGRQGATLNWIALQGREVAFKDAHGAFPETAIRTMTYDLARLVQAGALQRRGTRRHTRYWVEQV